MGKSIEALNLPNEDSKCKSYHYTDLESEIELNADRGLNGPTIRPVVSIVNFSDLPNIRDFLTTSLRGFVHELDFGDILDEAFGPIRHLSEDLKIPLQT